MLEQVTQAMAQPLTELLLVLLNAGIVLGLKWLREHVKNKGAIDALDHISQTAYSVVVSLNQEVVEALKNDGKFDAKERAEIKARALQMVHQQIAPASKAAAGRMVTDVSALVNQYIENAVVQAKSASPLNVITQLPQEEP